MTGSVGEWQSPETGTEIHNNTFNGPTAINTGSGDQNVYFIVATLEQRERVLAGLREESAGFVGRRAEVAELLDILRPGTGENSAVCAIAGLAGVGKTALAAHVAHRAVEAGWFHDGVWLNLRGFEPQDAPMRKAEAVRALLRALGLEEDLPPTADEQFELYHRILAELAKRGRPVLVVLDNVANADQIDGLLPRQAMHRVLITSRTSLSSLHARLIDLNLLDADDAIALQATALRNAHPDDSRATDERALATLAQVCGMLPLALQIAAALLKSSPKRSVGSLAQQLSDEQSRLNTLRYPDSASRGVRAALQLSYNRLTEAQARMLRLLAVEPGPDIATATAAATAGLAEQEAEALLYALQHACLVVCDEHQRWTMHDLVRLYARELLEADSAEHTRMRDRLLDYYYATADAADDHLNALPNETVSELFTGRVEALEWLDANKANLVATVRLAADSGNLEIAMILPGTLDEYFHWRRSFPEQIETNTMALNAARILRDRDGEAYALFGLGCALQGLERFEESIEALQQSLEISTESSDQDGQGSALISLGASLRRAGRLTDAAVACQQAAAICREIDDLQGEGMALGNLTPVLRMQGRLKEAVDVCRQIIAIYRKLGDKHHEGTALNNLGVPLLELERFEDAADAYRRAATILSETGDRHGEAMAINNLGEALRHLGRFQEAINCCQQAAAMHHEIGDRSGEGLATGNIGEILQLLGREECVDAYRYAAAIYREIGDKYNEGAVLSSISSALGEAGRLAEAIDASQKAATIFRELGDRDAENETLAIVGLLERFHGQQDRSNMSRQSIPSGVCGQDARPHTGRYQH